MFALRFSFKRKRKVKIIVIKNIAKKKPVMQHALLIVGSFIV